MPTGAMPRLLSRALRSASEAVDAISSAKASANLYGRLSRSRVAHVRQPPRFGIEAHQAARLAEIAREPRIGDFALCDGGHRVVPDRDIDDVAFAGERHFELQHARCFQPERGRRQARLDQRHLRQFALAQELTIGVDDDPLAVADAVDLEPGRGQRGAFDRDAAASLDRVQEELCDRSGHRGTQTLNRKFSTSPSRTTYSLPSARILPASLAPCSPLWATKSS